MNVTSLQDTGPRLLIHHGQCRPGGFYRFPTELCSGEAEKDMVLTTSMCSEALAYFGDILGDMLKGLPVTISELTILLHPVPKYGQLIAGPYSGIKSQLPHNVFRITCPRPSSNVPGEMVTESWIIDATGAQFNILTTCLEEEKYMSRYVQKLTSVNPAGIAKTMYNELSASAGLPGLHHLQRQLSAKSSQTGIARWKSTSSLTLPSLLRLPEKEYCAATEKLLDMVRKELKMFTLLWDKKKEVDVLLKLPTEVHIRHHEEGMRVFDKYGRMGMVE
ncbi:hypothetical protein BKA63DRAFT_492073 [Paraphoma chrysanthemicola]|nr:hypothetical protein BKA63DRAFT_492073 [Paraphoma chrysanthemicola]